MKGPQMSRQQFAISDGEDVRVRCEKVSVIGFGNLEDTYAMLIELERQFQCDSVWGFSREGCWEALICFYVKRSKRVTLGDVHAFFDAYPAGALVTNLGRGCSRHMLACLSRIEGFSERFGKIPRNAKRRLAEYKSQSQERQLTDNVGQSIGVEYNIQNFVRMHDELTTHRRVTSMILRQLPLILHSACSNSYRHAYSELETFINSLRTEGETERPLNPVPPIGSL